jgi:hypothetical protein
MIHLVTCVHAGHAKHSLPISLEEAQRITGIGAPDRRTSQCKTCRPYELITPAFGYPRDPRCTCLMWRARYGCPVHGAAIRAIENAHLDQLAQRGNDVPYKSTLRYFPLTEDESRVVRDAADEKGWVIRFAYPHDRRAIDIDGPGGRWAVGQLMTARYADKTVWGEVVTGHVGAGKYATGAYQFRDGEHFVFPASDPNHPYPVAPGTLAEGEPPFRINVLR